MKLLSLKKIGIIALASLMLAGCSDPIVGEFTCLEDPYITFTAKSDGTCTFENGDYGTETACEWKKEEDDSYSIIAHSFLGEVEYQLTKKAKNKYKFKQITNLPFIDESETITFKKK